MTIALLPGSTRKSRFWTSENYDAFMSFILSYLELVNSIKLVMHTPAILIKDDEEIEIHLQ